MLTSPDPSLSSPSALTASRPRISSQMKHPTELMKYTDTLFLLIYNSKDVTADEEVQFCVDDSPSIREMSGELDRTLKMGILNIRQV